MRGISTGLTLTTLLVYPNNLSNSITYLSNWSKIQYFSSSKSHKSEEKLFIEEFENKVKNLVDRDDTSVRSQSNPSRYHVGVFKRLKDFKESDPTNLENSEALEMVQVEIEEMTLDYDEQSISKTSRDLIQLMIHDNEPSVRDKILQMKGIANLV
jgi:hypothetical protein